MRDVISNGGLPFRELLWSSGLNAVYIFLAFLFFHWNFKIVKRKGLLVRIGE